MDMKRVILVTVVLFFVTSCGNSGGIGGKGSRKGFEPPPENMTIIPKGSFEMGSNDEDYVWAMNAPLRRRTTDDFFMDLTETTNLSYREFVNWTADSIARRVLANEGLDGFFFEDDEEDPEPDPNDVRLNYRTAIHIRSPKQKSYEEHYPVLRDKEFFYSKQEALGQKRVIDTRKLYYKYKYFDLRQAAKARWVVDENGVGHYEGKVMDKDGKSVDVQDRGSFMVEEDVPVYPDTLSWIRDFFNSYNEPLSRAYFWHPAYDYYPVVGVSWKQATAFCHWRSYHAKEKRYRNQYPAHEYRLPMEVEFEYAARGGLEGNLYPWGSMYNTNSSGCFLANFKPQRGDYALDGFSRTSPVAQYEPNEFGLYDMAGNVSEWVNDTYDENGYETTHDLVPVYHQHVFKGDKASKKRKVVRGGSWKDISYFMQTGARNYDYMDSTHSYIGFRTVRDAVVGNRQPGR
ncbi:MAG: formylglycine-generating enzyme family protein [Prevotellaceae bacterium]|jgi:formylglycine-generating enzyme required for sulfatase activity|nr:formylglycine-generating enzyme family protein [Prevotellaceae bacterium]